MNDHRPPLWGYDALAIALVGAFVVALGLLAAEAVSLCVQAVLPPAHRLLRWAGLDPPQWSVDLLELADLLEQIVERILYELLDRLDRPLFAAARWLWRWLRLDWVIEVALLVGDIVSVLPAEAWRRITTGGSSEGKIQPTDQHPGHLHAGRGLDDGGRSGDRSESDA